jgi:tellurium resistance protein TerD
MPVKLSKGITNSEPSTNQQEIPANTQNRITMQLVWEKTIVNDYSIDCDASALLLGNDGKVRGIQDFIFYNQLQHVSGSVIHYGDNLGTSENENPSEEISVILAKVPLDISRIAFAATIEDGKSKQHYFGKISNASIKLINNSTNKEMAMYDLGNAGNETAIIFGELYRNDNVWDFKTMGQGFEGLSSICEHYGVKLN